MTTLGVAGAERDPITVAAVAAGGTDAVSPELDSEIDGGSVELVGHVVGRRTGARTVDSPYRANLRANLRDEVVRFLLGALLVAQVADLWTTHVALGSQQLMERNPLFRPLFQALPGLADGLKLGAVLLVATAAMAVLPAPKSRHALLLAAALSIVAPISNAFLLGGHL